MNRRQKLKRLKQDNMLMRKIIRDCPSMEALYEAYNSVPKNITHTYMHFEQIKAYHTLPLEEDLRNLDTGIIKAYRDWLAKDICEEVKKYISYDTENRGTCLPRMEASLYVGIKI